MYERFYGFRERPFSLLPDPDFLFLGDNHRTALDLLELAVVNQSGFCVISGEIGAGKTTLIRELLNRVGDNVRVGLVSNTHRSFGELMQWIMAAYGLPCRSSDRLELHQRFIDFVIQNYAHGQTTLLIIDEAQNLSVSALEELRMLSNINSDKDLVLQAVLVGQGQLRDKLKLPVLQQFAQRIAIDFHLSGLDEEETGRYIRHRTSHAGAAADLFSDAACGAVYRFSSGIPRLINRICDLALVYGYAEECTQITADLVQAVVDDQRMGKVLDAARRHPGSAHLLSLTSVAPAGSADITPQPVAVAAPAMPALSVASPGDGDIGIAGEQTTPAPDARPPMEPPPGPTDAEQQAVPQTSDAEPAATVPSQLHALVVGAEQQKRGRRRGARAGLWVWAGIVVLTTAATWASLDVWYPSVKDAVAGLAGPGLESRSAAAVLSADRQRQTAPEPRVTAEPRVAAAPSLPAADPAPRPEPSPEPEPEDIAEQATARAEMQPPTAQPEPKTEKKAVADAAKIETAAARAAAQAEQAAREAELLAERQRVARVKQESERLNRERLAAERRLAEQRRVREALEQQARRDQEQRRAASMVETVERSAPKDSSSQPAVRASLPKLQPAARASLPKIDQAQSVESSADADDQPETHPPGRGAMPAQQPETAAAAHKSDAGAVSAAAMNTSPADARPAQTSAVEDEQAATKKFLANPCNGPTARFMSTCF